MRPTPLTVFCLATAAITSAHLTCLAFQIATAEAELAAVRNQEIGFVFQTFNLIPRQTALDNVALPLVYAGIGKEERLDRAADVLRSVGLGDRMDHRPNQLSGGQRQRVAIARAVITRPDVLVADEPTGNVDPDMAARLLRLFEALNQLGTTIVVATHDLHLLNRIPGAHIMRLADGQLPDPTGTLRNPPLREPVAV